MNLKLIMGSSHSSQQSETMSNKANPTSNFNEFIQKEITSHDIVIFSKTNCSYCKQAKSVLDTMRHAYRVIELDVNSQCPLDDCKTLTRYFILLTHMRTVPQIFVKGKLIGGFIEMNNLIKTKEFETLLKK